MLQIRQSLLRQPRLPGQFGQGQTPLLSQKAHIARHHGVSFGHATTLSAGRNSAEAGQGGSQRAPDYGARCPGRQIDPDLLNAGKIPVTEPPEAANFHHADSFAMMRGGHLDICVLGAFQMSASGDLANWHTGEAEAIPAVGGAMDLTIGAKQVFVMMTLFTKDGAAARARMHLPAHRSRVRQPCICRPRHVQRRPRMCGRP
ncbi:CoA-transferase [Streptomyces sp. 2A115]|uniref:CoA-transferase n=1 Tax=Streptomyces sp. 2A115 TaxID=3457439 RepID=UPI003FD54FB5